VVETNLDSAFFVTRHFVGSMVERGDGVILQMSSVTGIKGNIGQTNYGATKAALIGMTKSLALELSRFNIRVNAVVPGFIATEMLTQIPEAQQASLRKGIPLRRFGTVKEVAALCLFLASVDATYMTGQTFVIDGGLTV
jgi:3-oxoacyl-[acyl-carrier protein] reductase